MVRKEGVEPSGDADPKSAAFAILLQAHIKYIKYFWYFGWDLNPQNAHFECAAYANSATEAYKMAPRSGLEPEHRLPVTPSLLFLFLFLLILLI